VTAGTTSESGRWQGAADPGVGTMRIIEVLTVVLLAVATIGSAWCAYQVSRWNGVDTDRARESAVLRIDASRSFALATQKFSYDAAAVARYAEAFRADDTEMMTFLRTTLVRPEFLPLLDEWEALVVSGEGLPGNLFEDEEYIDSLFAEATALDEASVAATAEADEAGQTADDYVVTTLFMASALFFAGVTASFTSRGVRMVLISLSVVVLAVAGTRLLQFPVA
jgi:hypothetical protein